MEAKYNTLIVIFLLFFNYFSTLANDDYDLSQYNNDNIIENCELNSLSKIKTYLRDNYKVIDFIESQDFIKKRLWIDNYNLEELSNIIYKLPENKIKDTKQVIELVKNDIFINKELKILEENVKYIFDETRIEKEISSLEGHIDIINKSIEYVWNYWLNYKLLEKSKNLIKKLEENKNRKIISTSITKINDIKEQTILYKQEIEENIANIKESIARETYSDEVKLSSSEINNDMNIMTEDIINLNNDIKVQIEEKRQIIEDEEVSEEEIQNLEQEIIDLEASQSELDDLLKQIEELKKENSKKNDANTWLSIVIFILFLSLWLLWFKYFRIKRIRKTKDNIKTKTLQILRNWNEYSIEYDGIYNKWIKVLETNKHNITSSIEDFVKSMNKLTKTRWLNILDKLNKLNIETPDLEESGSTIYRLFLPENIRNELKQQKWNLIIKTDEQEIPWELMHDWENFLCLKFPIARHIMTREHIRINKKTINKKPKILFIINPTWDLDWTEKEAKEIIKKLWKKADISLIKWEKANSIKVFSLLWKDDWDIIHYSGHAYFNKENPDESGIILNNNHIISCSEIKRSLNWNPLIFLNACSSGKSINDDDFSETWEDTIGLASSFIIGWAKWVVSTMWPVNDNIAKDFAIDFYSNFLKWVNVWESILEAKQNCFSKECNDTKCLNGITWASFIYYWDPDITIDLN